MDATEMGNPVKITYAAQQLAKEGAAGGWGWLYRGSNWWVGLAAEREQLVGGAGCIEGAAGGWGWLHRGSSRWVGLAA